MSISSLQWPFLFLTLVTCVFFFLGEPGRRLYILLIFQKLAFDFVHFLYYCFVSLVCTLIFFFSALGFCCFTFSSFWRQIIDSPLFFFSNIWIQWYKFPFTCCFCYIPYILLNIFSFFLLKNIFYNFSWSFFLWLRKDVCCLISKYFCCFPMISQQQISSLIPFCSENILYMNFQPVESTSYWWKALVSTCDSGFIYFSLQLLGFTWYFDTLLLSAYTLKIVCLLGELTPSLCHASLYFCLVILLDPKFALSEVKYLPEYFFISANMVSLYILCF